MAYSPTFLSGAMAVPYANGSSTDPYPETDLSGSSTGIASQANQAGSSDGDPFGPWTEEEYGLPEVDFLEVDFSDAAISALAYEGSIQQLESDGEQPESATYPTSTLSSDAPTSPGQLAQLSDGQSIQGPFSDAQEAESMGPQIDPQLQDGSISPEQYGEWSDRQPIQGLSRDSQQSESAPLGTLAFDECPPQAVPSTAGDTDFSAVPNYLLLDGQPAVPTMANPVVFGSGMTQNLPFQPDFAQPPQVMPPASRPQRATMVPPQRPLAPPGRSSTPRRQTQGTRRRRDEDTEEDPEAKRRRREEIERKPLNRQGAQPGWNPALRLHKRFCKNTEIAPERQVCDACCPLREHSQKYAELESEWMDVTYASKKGGKKAPVYYRDTNTKRRVRKLFNMDGYYSNVDPEVKLPE